MKNVERELKYEEGKWMRVFAWLKSGGVIA
jgi:hypothetical protein